VPAFQKYHCFTADLAHGRHNLASDVLIATLALRDPLVASDTVVADAQPLQSNYISPVQITAPSVAQINGVLTFRADPIVIQTQGAPVQMRYVVLYSATSANRLIGFYDFGIPHTLIPGAVTVSGVSGVPPLQIFTLV
jgi:hypothetical protein